MSDLINRMNLYNEVVDYCHENGYLFEMDGMLENAIENIILEAPAVPSADTAEIVHCKDCIYRPIGHVAHNVSAPVIDGVEYRVCPCLCEDSWYSTNPADDFFCAKGSIGV